MSEGMGQEPAGGAAVGRLFSRTQLSLARAITDFNALSARLGIGRLEPGLGLAEAGNTACDSGCDGGCGGELAGRPELVNEINATRTARVSAVLGAIRTSAAGMLNLDRLTEALESGNSACDSGCNSGCGGLLRPEVARQSTPASQSGARPGAAGTQGGAQST
jgi:hypothetical protein